MNIPMHNQSLIDRSRAAVWHPCTQMKQHERLPIIPISHGSGVWLYDFDGKRYLDAISSWWVNLFGHANPRINAALREQLEQLEHVILAGFTHAPVIELSERLARLAPGNLGHCFYASDGASAIEIALKMSFHFWRNTGQPQKTGFISLRIEITEAGHGLTVHSLPVKDQNHRQQIGTLMAVGQIYPVSLLLIAFLKKRMEEGPSLDHSRE